MDLSGHIQDLIPMAETMKQQPGANKKALNKTIARLEEAQLWANQINIGRVNGVPNTPAPINGTQECSCVLVDGSVVAMSKHCKIHGQIN
jgi:hypothetical protein